MKKLFALSLVAFMMLAMFAACTPTAPTTDATSAPTTTGATTTAATTAAGTTEAAAEPVSLKYWAYARWQGIKGNEQGGEYGDWQREQARLFTEANPNVAIEFEHLPWNGGPEKVNVAIASNTQPDVLEDGTVRAFGYAAQDVLQSFDDKLTPDELADIPESEWELVKWTDGKHYCMPWGNMSTFALINLDMFKAAGAEDLLPSNDERSWTPEEFEAALAAVSNPSGGVYGAALFAGNEQGDNQVMAFLRGFGASLLSDDLKTATLNSPEAVECGEWLLSLVEKGYVMPGAESILATDSIDYFKQQKIAILTGGAATSFATIGLEMEKGDIETFEMGWALLPSKAGIDPTFNANPVAVMAFKSGNAAQEQAAVDLAKFVTSGENAKAVSTVKLLPTRKSAGDLYPGVEIMAFSSRVVKYAVDPGFGTPVYAQIRATLFPELQAIYSKAKTPEAAFADFDTKAQELLDNVK